VAQALRPYPQYLDVRAYSGGGDKTGRSNYHAGVLKLTQRMKNGLAVQASYTYSHVMTDADSFSGGAGSRDAAQPELEYSIGGYDQPHSIKANVVYELPFGPGKPWLQSGVGSVIFGGWRVAVSALYSSGIPIRVTSNAALNIFAAASYPNVTGEAWCSDISNFDPATDLYLNKAAFVQPVGAIGDAPRTNGNCRRAWNKEENISIGKSFQLGTSRLDFRWEVFNLFNRVIWNAPNSNFSSSTFGVVSSQYNDPRRMQFALKWYW